MSATQSSKHCNQTRRRDRETLFRSLCVQCGRFVLCDCLGLCFVGEKVEMDRDEKKERDSESKQRVNVLVNQTALYNLVVY